MLKVSWMFLKMKVKWFQFCEYEELFRKPHWWFLNDFSSQQTWFSTTCPWRYLPTLINDVITKISTHKNHKFLKASQLFWKFTAAHLKILHYQNHIILFHVQKYMKIFQRSLNSIIISVISNRKIMLKIFVCAHMKCN